MVLFHYGCMYNLFNFMLFASNMLTYLLCCGEFVKYHSGSNSDFDY